MREHIKQVIIESMGEVDEINVDLLELTGNESIEELHINSLAFIKMIVYIETELDIEIDDEDLNLNHYNTLNDFIDVLEKNLNNK